MSVSVSDPPAAAPAWHAQDGAAVLAALGTPADGLSAGEAAARLAAVGPNATEGRRGDSPATLLLRQLANPLIVVLLVSGAIAIALGDLVDGAVVLGVVVANAVIGFLQEWRAERAIEALGSMIPEEAVVVRDGGRVVLHATEVVPGDLVELTAGARVPADARLVRARALEVDESPLTGESLPVGKSTEPVDEATPVADRAGMVHGGTLVTTGAGGAVVVATGAATELGKIAGLLGRTEGVKTPLTRRLDRFARWLSGAICVLAVVLVAVALARGYSALDATLAAMALAVAAIPEGLPAIVTIALAIGVQRMAARRAVVRRLPAVETLGSTTVICTDKTGTLTRNEMRVVAAWTPAGGAWRDDWGGERELLGAGVLCSDAADPEQLDPTEAALVGAAVEGGVDPAALRRAWPRLDELPFDGSRKLMATLHEDPEGRRIAFMKGAPEAVLAQCGEVGPAQAAMEEMAARGMRVLAVARRRAVERLDLAIGPGWELLGLEAMIDPAREDAVVAVAACRDAGIDVKMITGDHIATARAIGERFGLDGAGLAGADLDALDDEAFAGAAASTSVFARVVPEHKLRLVRALQAQGQVVAMTGDGVNDAPALRQADIGVAMGAGGTATAREAADVVLTDDDFSSIEAAVEEGRRVYDNIQKAIAFVLPTNIGEALIILVAVLFFPFSGGEPLLPVHPTQILWVNLIATVTLALPLAVEAGEPGLMRRRPRAPGGALLSRALLWRTVLAALLMTAAALAVFALERRAALDGGAAAESALAAGQTAAVTAIVLFQAVYLLECRSLRVSVFAMRLGGNPWVWAGIGAVLALQCAFIYAPPLQDLFGSAALGARGWGLAALAAVTVLPAIEAEKWWRSRRERRTHDEH
jgi:calcium-translocating P-type ATPase